MPESFLNKFAEKETLVQVFSCEFREIFKNTFLTVIIWTTSSFFLKKKLAQVFSRELCEIDRNADLEECLRTVAMRKRLCGGVSL